MEQLLLSGAWTLRRRRDGKTFPAVLPGTDFGALIRAGEIENPLRSGVEDEALRTAREDYSFLRTFFVEPSLLERQHAHLCCAGVDTLCDIYLNGALAFGNRSAFVPLDQDVKAFLREGENKIELRFASPVKFIEEAYRAHALPPNPNGVDGIPYIRKPGCHFGWDWGPCVPWCGVTDDITLQFFDTRITCVRVTQQTTQARALVKASADGAARIRLFAPDGSEIPGDDGVFTVEAPELWATYEMNGKDKQPLYTLVFENDETSVTRRIGLRSLTVDRSADAYGENFCFLLNGARVFAKGANLIPFSALFEDSDNATVDRYLALARRANFNMLRVWGGGNYASEHLLEKCDEMGILIWQDFAFACQMYPLYDPAFCALVMKEVACQVERMETHPSLALWCGNNEIEESFLLRPIEKTLRSSYVSFFYDTLQPYMRSHAQTPFIPSSPFGCAPFKRVTDDSVGDTHLWSVWHGLKKLNYYQTRFTRFLSEFGMESLPSLNSISTFASPAEYSMESAPFQNHQKCVGGNRKMLFYLTELFDMPAEFTDLPALTGLVQSECLKRAAVHFRQNKGRCNGCLIWQFNDVWNCPSWSMVDFEEVPKAALYHARDFFAPVAVTCRLERGRATLAAHNDTLRHVRFPVTLRVLNLESGEAREEELVADLEQDSVVPLKTLRVKPTDVLQFRWLEHFVTELCCAPRKLRLPHANLRVTTEGGRVTIESDVFAFGVHIAANTPPSDNDFSLFPGERCTVEFAEPPQNLQVSCVNNMAFDRRKLRRLLFRGLYRLRPKNLTREIYYILK